MCDALKYIFVYCFFVCHLNVLQSMSLVPYQEKCKVSAIENLPDDCLQKIFSYCSNSYRENNVARVNKRFLECADKHGF